MATLLGADSVTTNGKVTVPVEGIDDETDWIDKLGSAIELLITSSVVRLVCEFSSEALVMLEIVKSKSLLGPNRG